ncbi:aminoacyl-tRNA hydrolase [Sulfitobacter sp. R18_1]|uniref:aminoacyl-tRNA hydrolase n=1 Tax=Sulfitobacter sp. R18_1 TaxID=2821104 RepID=UPI001ADBA0C3|nr:aminoacyl-tRNA hydrolase [Sulfitobacter sp. R18_1]MBO9427965.1 aminoacyl-tRNA hydrolase [Sulfitobacter sp. R18_1]
MTSELRQVIVVRRDLKMTRGKESGQVGHAVLDSIVPRLSDPVVQEWYHNSQAKIIVSVDSEDELLAVAEKAVEAGIHTAKIIDEGRTMFNGVKTLTCVALGPAKRDELDPITGHLKLR